MKVSQHFRGAYRLCLQVQINLSNKPAGSKKSDVQLNCRLTFTRLCIISQKIEIFIATSVRTSSPTHSAYVYSVMTYGIAFGSNLFDINKTFLLQKDIKIVMGAQRTDLLKKIPYVVV
jgi:hypothetical protein